MKTFLPCLVLLILASCSPKASVSFSGDLEPIELSPVEEDTFSGDVFFIGEVAFMRGPDGAVTGFTVSNGRTKGVQFYRFTAGE